MTRLQGEKIEMTGRNEPCPCGSGKKYKKCCEKTEAAKMVEVEQNQILQSVLQEFFENHPRSSEQKELLAWKNKTEDLLVPLYGEDKSGGIIGDVYFFSERTDIWNLFIEQKIQQEQRLQIKQIIESWLNPLFLAGEILSIVNYRAQMRDLLSGEIYEIDVNESFAVEQGHIAFGFYLPDMRINERFLMVLNSMTAAVDVNPETIEKLKDMYHSSEEEDPQNFYKRNMIAVYQMFSSGLRSNDKVSDEVLRLVEELEHFLIEQNLKSDSLIEAFFHYLAPLSDVPDFAVGGAVHFGISHQLLKSDWDLSKIAEYFNAEQEEIQVFADGLRAFYDETLKDQEKEAVYAFEVGTNPKANELQNWQLFMHLKNAAITSEAALKRQMEYYHAKAYEPKSDSEKAQLLFYELFSKKSEQPHSEISQKVHQLDPHLADGFLLAADVETDITDKEMLLKKAIQSGKTHYEPDMDVPWLYVPNRPYLRALYLLGVHYWEIKDYDKAFLQFQKLLHLNPGDHQGVRYITIASLISLNRLEEATSLIAHYEEQYTDNAFYAWFKWMIQRGRSLHSNVTQELFLEAVDQNPYAKKYVEQRLEALPYPKMAIISPRSPEEAQLIWSFLAPSMTR